MVMSYSLFKYEFIHFLPVIVSEEVRQTAALIYLYNFHTSLPFWLPLKRTTENKHEPIWFFLKKYHIAKKETGILIHKKCHLIDQEKISIMYKGEKY